MNGCPACGYEAEIDEVDVETSIEQDLIAEVVIALERGDIAKAREAFPLIFRDLPGVQEWIEQARYSVAARCAA
ncbi:MAG: hypothetical protein JOZ16_08635 [Methylobacteriaceae bacterium]|nr:hypothetical protein [Methylobacteriaceae bacterium]